MENISSSYFSNSPNKHLAQLNTIFRDAYTRLNVEAKIDFVKNYIREKPAHSFVIAMILLFSLAPILTFIIFALFTLTVTFFGFVLVEGTLITSAASILIITLMTFISVALALSMMVIALNYLCKKVYSGMKKIKSLSNLNEGVAVVRKTS